MPWNGSGSYVLPPAYSPEVNGTVIDAVRYNGLTSDVASGISNTIARDGQNVPSANLPMSGFKHTGAGDGAGAGQYLVYGQTTAAVLGGTLAVALGVVGAPSYSFGGDSNTGMWSPTADTLAWSLGGAEVARYNATGFGFGTTPSQKFHVANAGTFVAFFEGTSNNSRVAIRAQSKTGAGANIAAVLNVQGDTPIINFGAETAHVLAVLMNNSEVSRWDTTGAFGVGGTPSGAKVDVFGSVKVRDQDYINSNATGGEARFGYGSYDGTSAWNFGTSSANPLGFITNSTRKLILDSVGRFGGYALHNNASSVAGTAIQYIASGTYTPTGTTGSNVTAVTPGKAYWIRVGNVVTVCGAVSATLTAAVTSDWSLSLPLASNLASTSDLTGVLGTKETGNWQAIYILGDSTNDRAQFFVGSPAGTGARNFVYTFSYEVL